MNTQIFLFSELSNASKKRAIKNTMKHFPDSYPPLEEGNVEGLGYDDECVIEDMEANKLRFNKKGEIIDNNLPTDSMEKFLKGIDFKLLKKQKSNLFNIQAKMEKKDQTFTQNEWNVIEGIINLVDRIQEIAVDEYGYDEKEAFHLTKD